MLGVGRRREDFVPAGTIRAFRSPWTFGRYACEQNRRFRACGHDQGFPVALDLRMIRL